MTLYWLILTLSLFLLIYADSLLTSTAILWLSNDSLLTSTYSLLTLYWLSADFYSSPGWPGWLDLPEGSNCLEFETTTCWDMLAHLKIWISATGHYSRCKFQHAGKKHITWVKKKIIVMFVLNLAFVHQCSIHPKYKSLCKYGPSVEGTFSIMMFWTHQLYTKTHYTPKYRMLCLWAPWAHGCGGYIFCWDALNITYSCVCL